jgi:hypothetical protein
VEEYPGFNAVEVRRLVYFFLLCMSEHCPDRRYQRIAKRELRHPTFVEAAKLDVEMVAQARREKFQLHVNPGGEE